VLQPLLESGLVPVVTGFVGATRDGRVTTLGRNARLSGAIVAHVVDANELVVWTDVDGVYTANPKESSEAAPPAPIIVRGSACARSAGAKVLHAEVLRCGENRNGGLGAETHLIRNFADAYWAFSWTAKHENSQRGAA